MRNSNQGIIGNASIAIIQGAYHIRENRTFWYADAVEQNGKIAKYRFLMRMRTYGGNSKIEEVGE